jgi:hypothetical protein
MAGQLWVQGDRMMTASNPPFDGMANTREAAVLTAAAEAIAWKNETIESPGQRKGQRVVIYPKELTQLESVLSSGDPNIDPEDGHPVAYQRVLQAASEFEVPPIFPKEDCEAVRTDPKKAEAVPQWMCLAERIATGSRSRVLEDGPDTYNSDEDAAEDVEADKELGMYTSEMDPILGPKKLSQQEVATQRASANAMKLSQSGGFSTSSLSVSSDFTGSLGSTRQPTPANSDDEEMTEDQKRAANQGKKRAAKSAPKSAPPNKKAEVGTSGTRSRAVPDPTLPTQVSKAVAPPVAPADQPKGAKAPPQTKGQESPEAKASHPMQTRMRASGAGGLRPGGGSGQTDTCVAQGNPSKT